MPCDIDKHFHLGKDETNILITLIQDKLSKRFAFKNDEIIINESVKYINSFPETLTSFIEPLSNMVNLYDELFKII